MGYNRCCWENTQEAEGKGIPSMERRAPLLNPTADGALGTAMPPRKPTRVALFETLSFSCTSQADGKHMFKYCQSRERSPNGYFGITVIFF